MATVTSSTEPRKTFSLKGLSYKEATEKVLGNLAAWDSQFTTLKTALEKTPAEIQQIASEHIAKQEHGALKSLLNRSYEYYQVVLDEQRAALGVLQPLDAQLQEAIRYCTPPKVSLPPEYLEDLTKHGYDMSCYPNQELELAESTNDLLDKSKKIQAVIEKIHAFITNCPYAMNGAARAVKQTTREKTWGDKLPEKIVGETKYFMEGFRAFQQQNPKTQVAPSEESTHTPEAMVESERTETPAITSSSDSLNTRTPTMEQKT